MGAEKVVVVVGHRAEMVRNAFRDEPGISFALQEPQLGTGHALMCAAKKLTGHSGPVMVLSGDVPALRPATLNNLLKVHSLGGHSLTVLGMDLENPGHYGRMITGPDGLLRRIVEYKDASPEERSVGLVNAGVYAARCEALLKYLPKLTDANRQHEYYINRSGGADGGRRAEGWACGVRRPHGGGRGEQKRRTGPHGKLPGLASLALCLSRRSAPAIHTGRNLYWIVGAGLFT